MEDLFMEVKLGQSKDVGLCLKVGLYLMFQAL